VRSIGGHTSAITSSVKFVDITKDAHRSRGHNKNIFKDFVEGRFWSIKQRFIRVFDYSINQTFYYARRGRVVFLFFFSLLLGLALTDIGPVKHSILTDKPVHKVVESPYFRENIGGYIIKVGIRISSR